MPGFSEQLSVISYQLSYDNKLELRVVDLNQQEKKTMNNTNANTMVPTKDIYQFRIKPFVDQVITEDKDSVYLDKHGQEDWLAHIQAELMEYLPFEQFMTWTDDELEELVGKQMALELVAGMLNDFTPAQMATFNECLVRR
jgi:hypothetical protein